MRKTELVYFVTIIIKVTTKTLKMNVPMTSQSITAHQSIQKTAVNSMEAKNLALLQCQEEHELFQVLGSTITELTPEIFNLDEKKGEIKS